MPGGEVGGEEEGGDGDRRCASLRPGQWTGWPVTPAISQQERQRQRQPPEAGRDRPDPAAAPATARGQRAAADQQGGEGKRMIWPGTRGA